MSSNLFDLTGKTALITGSGRQRVGYVVAKHMAAQGYNIAGPASPNAPVVKPKTVGTAGRSKGISKEGLLSDN